MQSNDFFYDRNEIRRPFAPWIYVNLSPFRWITEKVSWLLHGIQNLTIFLVNFLFQWFPRNTDRMSPNLTLNTGIIFGLPSAFVSSLQRKSKTSPHPYRVWSILAHPINGSFFVPSFQDRRNRKTGSGADIWLSLHRILWHRTNFIKCSSIFCSVY